MRLHLQFLAPLPLFLPPVSKHCLLRSLMPYFSLILVFYPPTLVQTSFSFIICGTLGIIPELPKLASLSSSNFPSSRQNHALEWGFGPYNHNQVSSLSSHFEICNAPTCTTHNVLHGQHWMWWAQARRTQGYRSPASSLGSASKQAEDPGAAIMEQSAWSWWRWGNWGYGVRKKRSEKNPNRVQIWQFFQERIRK